MNKLILIVVTLLSAQSFANGSAMYKNLGCAGCHGVGGKSVISTYPSLAGKSAFYIVKQLKDFQTGVRKNGTMNAMAPMAAGHEQVIANYLAAQ